MSFISLTALSYAQCQTENVFLRWKEVVGSADSYLLFDPAFTSDTGKLKKQFWAE